MVRLGHSVETIYATLALFALTQGPVYRIWESSANFLQTSPQPSMPHIHFATFVAVQLPAVLLLGRNASELLRSKKSSIPLVLLMSWLGMTVLWSTLARHSLPEYVALLLTTAFGVYLSTSFSAEKIWRIIASAMATGLGFSLVAIWRSWNAAVSEVDGHWIGIYYNRNSLAPVAAVAAIASIGMAVTSRRSPRILYPVSVCGVLLLTASIAILWKSESQTSPFALIVAFVALLVWFVLRWIMRFRSGSAVWWSPAAASLLFIATVLVLVLRSIGRLSNASGGPLFNSRGVLWSVSWSAIQSKPWHGWGWLAAWHTPDFFKQGAYWGLWDTTWSHNGYHDLMLGGGFTAIGLFVLYLIFAAYELDKCPTTVGSMALFSVVFVLAAATQESFFIGSHFLWALLICSTTIRWGSPKKLFEQQDTTKSLA
jgi:exopolysaccharide production protein ExoQ